jgi:hypothetical protein
MTDSEIALIVLLFTITWAVLGWLTSEMGSVGTRLARIEEHVKILCGARCIAGPEGGERDG